MTTNKQKEDVRFCEDWLKITFKGNFNSQRSVSRFLSKYLRDAENAEREAIEFIKSNSIDDGEYYLTMKIVG